MKIKQPNYRCPVDCAADDAEIDVEIPTASLIAELEKRRPCGKCEWQEYKGNVEVCSLCMWGSVFHDNFKPAK